MLGRLSSLQLRPNHYQEEWIMTLRVMTRLQNSNNRIYLHNMNKNALLSTTLDTCPSMNALPSSKSASTRPEFPTYSMCKNVCGRVLPCFLCSFPDFFLASCCSTSLSFLFTSSLSFSPLCRKKQRKAFFQQKQNCPRSLE
ncbi:hypothetical protein Mapa_017321 [Marchantia paleacea]|nr:hypothetical protein Mapa_017321 [Marchantia paleacea]